MVLAFVLLVGCQNDDPVTPTVTKKFEFLQNIEIGSQPARIYYDETNQLFHVFCLGVDLDYDGQKDEGDENPSWWTVNKNDLSNPVKKLEFDFGFLGFPFRPYLDFTNRKLYISQSGLIKVFSLDSYSKIDEIAGDYYATAISGNNNYLFLSVPEYQKNGKVAVLDINTKQEISSISAGLNVQQNLYYELNAKQMLAVMSEGDGNGNAMIQFFEINSGILTSLKKFDGLGNFGNHISIYKNHLVYTLNGSHKLIIFDLNNFSITKNISIGTVGFEGPRETAFNSDNEIFVSTYKGDIRKYNLASGLMEQQLSTDSKAEGISILQNDIMLVANISKPDYSVNNIISIFKAK